MLDDPAPAGAQRTAQLEICPLCREWVDPTDTALQYAVELHADPLRYHEAREGAGAFFHVACYPWARGYRPKPHPWGWTAASES